MKCPNCQANLLPVDGEMFCLQCGTVVKTDPAAGDLGPEIEETSDPLLQEAIIDAARKPVYFKHLVTAGTPPKAAKSFNSMRSFLAPSRSAVVANAGSAHIVELRSVIEPPHAKPVVPIVPVKLRHGPSSRYLLSLSKVWITAFSVFIVFIAINMIVATLYSGKIYPGVRVGEVNVGGMPLGAAQSVLRNQSLPTLIASIGGSTYDLNTTRLGSSNWQTSYEAAEQIGHSTPLPIAGLIESVLSRPINERYQLNKNVLQSLVAQLADQFDHPASEPVPLIIDGHAFTIDGKEGQSLDESKAVTLIEQNYGVSKHVVIPIVPVPPSLTSSRYVENLDAANTTMSLTIKLKSNSATYAPTAQQIGNWLTIAAPGKGVVVNNALIANYISSIPGKFDRTAAFNSLINALHSRTSLQYNLNTSVVTSNPLESGSVLNIPSATYSYCINADPSVKQTSLAAVTATALSDQSGWALGGKLRFVEVSSDCNFSVNLVPSGDMASAAAACKGQSSCQVANTIELNLSSWLSGDPSWRSGIESYRSNMVAHEVGNWLGFEDASCTGHEAAIPILAQPTVSLDTCSPSWYPIPTSDLGKPELGF